MYRVTRYRIGAEWRQSRENNILMQLRKLSGRNISPGLDNIIYTSKQKSNLIVVWSLGLREVSSIAVRTVEYGLDVYGWLNFHTNK